MSMFNIEGRDMDRVDGIDGVEGAIKRGQVEGGTDSKYTKQGRPSRFTANSLDNLPERRRLASSASRSNNNANGASPPETKNREAFLARNRAAAHKCKQRKNERERSYRSIAVICKLGTTTRQSP